MVSVHLHLIKNRMINQSMTLKSVLITKINKLMTKNMWMTEKRCSRFFMSKNQFISFYGPFILLLLFSKHYIKEFLNGGLSFVEINERKSKLRLHGV